MSQDAFYIIRDKGQVQYFYNSWGGLYLDLDLLQGPEVFQHYIRGQQRLEKLFIESYIDGFAELDLEQRKVRYWGNSGFGLDAVSQRMYRTLLQAQWTGWTFEWLYQPTETMATNGSYIHTSPYTVSEVKAWQSDLWNDFKNEFTDLIELQGEVATRTNFETPFDLFNTWVTVRSEQGIRDELICNRYVPWYEQFFLLGPDLVDVLNARPERSFDELQLVESQLEAGCFIDLVDKRFSWWVQKPRWSPFYNMQQAWSGWELSVLSEGPISQLEIIGRDRYSLLSTYCLKQLDEWYKMLLGPRISPMKQLTKIADDLAKQSGRKVKITLPGVSNECTAQSSDWKNDVQNHYEALLNTMAFQPRKQVQ